MHAIAPLDSWWNVRAAVSISQSSGETDKRTLLLLRLNSIHIDTLYGNQNHKEYRLLEVQCYHTRLGLGMGTTTAAHSDFDFI